MTGERERERQLMNEWTEREAGETSVDERNQKLGWREDRRWKDNV